MYYGNSSAPDGQDVGGTYDVNYVAVYHLNEKEGAPKDATAYANTPLNFRESSISLRYRKRRPVRRGGRKNDDYGIPIPEF